MLASWRDFHTESLRSYTRCLLSEQAGQLPEQSVLLPWSSCPCFCSLGGPVVLLKEHRKRLPPLTHDLVLFCSNAQSVLCILPFLGRLHHNDLWGVWATWALVTLIMLVIVCVIFFGGVPACHLALPFLFRFLVFHSSSSRSGKWAIWSWGVVVLWRVEPGASGVSSGSLETPALESCLRRLDGGGSPFEAASTVSGGDGMGYLVI